MADNIFGTTTHTNQDFDGGWHTLGALAAVSADANLVGGRARWPSSAPANFLWVVYRDSDQVVVASANLATAVPSPVLGDWNDFTSAAFDSPGDIALDDAEQYVVAIATNGDFLYRTGFTYPAGTGIVTASEGRFHNGGSGAVFPTDVTSNTMFFADVLVETGGGPVAVAGTAIGVATSTAAVRKVGNASGAAQGIALGTAVAAKRAVVAGFGTAVGVARLTSTKVARAAGLATAVGGVQAGAAKVARASGTAAAVAAVASQVKKVANVSGVCTGIALGRRTAPEAPQIPGRLTATTSGSRLAASTAGSRLTATTTP